MNVRGLALVAALIGALLVSFPHQAQSATTDYPATLGIPCDAQSHPEGDLQGYISPEEFASGRAYEGYWCNARMVAHVPPGPNIGGGGGFRVERYVDSSGHECAYHDSAPLFPGSTDGVQVLDMSTSPPVVTAKLQTPAMLSPHESLRVNQKRGLLVAVLGMPATYPGLVEVYDLSDDCRAPRLLASTPLGILGHESGFAPDGLTFYVTSIVGSLTAIDLKDPATPQILYHSRTWRPHGVSLSNDGRALFMAAGSGSAETGSDDPGRLIVLDVTEIQDRKADPQVREISTLTWPEASIPQNATPFRKDGHDYLIETDEFGGGANPVGAARIINIDDLANPFVVSRLRLEVHNQPEKDFTTHYCTVPSRLEPTIIACGYLSSGLRVFDIRDVRRPREVAYANFTQIQNTIFTATGGAADSQAGNVYAAPAYDPDSNDVWFTDTQRGFFVVHLTKAAGINRFARENFAPGS